MSLWELIEERGPGVKKTHDPFESLLKAGSFRDEWDKREWFAINLSWAVPDKYAIQKIKEFVGDGTILEIGAGLGLWARLLQDEGVDIIPTDLKKAQGNYVFHEAKPYTKVLDFHYNTALKKFPNTDVLMMCWPPYSYPMAYESLKKFQGNKVVYVGEGDGGCCGCEKFWDMLHEEFNEVSCHNIPQWSGLHDYLALYERISTNTRKIEW